MGKPKVTSQRRVPSKPTNDEWACPECGDKQRSVIQCAIECGNRRSEQKE